MNYRALDVQEYVPSCQVGTESIDSPSQSHKQPPEFMCFQCQRILRLVKVAILTSPGNEVGSIHQRHKMLPETAHIFPEGQVAIDSCLAWGCSRMSAYSILSPHPDPH